MAERLGTGLQNLVQRFDSAWHLIIQDSPGSPGESLLWKMAIAGRGPVYGTSPANSAVFAGSRKFYGPSPTVARATSPGNPSGLSGHNHFDKEGIYKTSFTGGAQKASASVVTIVPS